MPALSSLARPPRQVIRRSNIGAVEGQRSTLTRMIGLIEGADAFGAVDKDEKASA
jgi:hypothetical protein